MSTTGDDLRVCLYAFEMGAYHKLYIQHVSRAEYERMNDFKPNFQKFYVILTEDDWYGERLPNAITSEKDLRIVTGIGYRNEVSALCV